MRKNWTSWTLAAAAILMAGPAFASDIVVPEPSLSLLVGIAGGGLYVARRLMGR